MLAGTTTLIQNEVFQTTASLRSTFSESGFSADEYATELADLRKDTKAAVSRGPATSR